MSQPFARSIAMFAAIAAATQGANAQFALSQIGPYESRGKGKGKRQASSRTIAMDKRAAKKSSNVKRHRAACRA